MNARTTALSALIACRKHDAWADSILKEYISRDRLDRRDAALATHLCYGVLQNRIFLDHMINSRLKGSIQKLQPVVLDILRLGVYQLLMMEKIPESAAVNEAVNQGKKYANPRAAGLINGVLRGIVRDREQLEYPTDPGVRYSHPTQLLTLLRETVGEQQLPALLQAHNQAPETLVHINPLVTDVETAKQTLETSGCTLAPHPWLPQAFYLSGGGNLEQQTLFRQGALMVQDSAARLAVLAAEPKPDMQVLDVCAAPGGKSFSAAIEMQNTGSVISCDIHPHKIELLRKGAERLGLSIVKPVLQDASVFVPKWENCMDLVIADVPCSGLGVIRKKPDIRYKDLTATEKLPEIQSRILDNVCRYVKPGGTLLYSTCTILRRENEDVVNGFLQNHPEFQPEPFAVPTGLHAENNGMLTLYPHIHQTDGFFICKLRRIQ